jgi:lipid-binding SYLF domain-containing protein
VAAAAPAAQGAASAGEAAGSAQAGAQPEAAEQRAAQPAVEHAATIEFEIYKAGFIVGVSGGRGTLHFQGKSYPVSIGGVSVGATAGISKAELIGEVRNLHSVSDIEGTYSATQAGLTVGGGEKITQLKNSRSVEMDVRGKQMGIELSLDLNGMEISLTK